MDKELPLTLAAVADASDTPPLERDLAPILADASQHSSNSTSTSMCSWTWRLPLVKEAARQQTLLHPPPS